MSETLDSLVVNPAPLTTQAVRIRTRGGPDQLRYDETVPLPQPLPGDAIVRVFATAITPTELAWPPYNDADGTDRFPSIPGHEIAGIIEALASNIPDLHAGDAVFGLTDFFRDGGARNM